MRSILVFQIIFNAWILTTSTRRAILALSVGTQRKALPMTTLLATSGVRCPTTPTVRVASTCSFSANRCCHRYCALLHFFHFVPTRHCSYILFFILHILFSFVYYFVFFFILTYIFLFYVYYNYICFNIFVYILCLMYSFPCFSL